MSGLSEVVWDHPLGGRGGCSHRRYVYTGSVSPVLPSTNPQLEAPLVVEVGSRWPVKGTLDGLFPAWDAEVYVVLGDKRLETIITYHEYFVLAEAWIEGNVCAQAR